jgi:ssDNA-binding Zn-finger/Zn-ribbon topoisomerase 1
MVIKKTNGLLIDTLKKNDISRFVKCPKCGKSVLKEREPNLDIYDCTYYKCNQSFFFFEEEQKIEKLEKALKRAENDEQYVDL